MAGRRWHVCLLLHSRREARVRVRPRTTVKATVRARATARVQARFTVGSGWVSCLLCSLLGARDVTQGRPAEVAVGDGASWISSESREYLRAHWQGGRTLWRARGGGTGVYACMHAICACMRACMHQLLMAPGLQRSDSRSSAPHTPTLHPPNTSPPNTPKRVPPLCLLVPGSTDTSPPPHVHVACTSVRRASQHVP